jgi:hypothetical protein
MKNTKFMQDVYDFVDNYVDSDDDIDWDSIGAPESVIVRSVEDLLARVEEAERSIAEGKTIPAEIVFEKMRQKYGFSS